MRRQPLPLLLLVLAVPFLATAQQPLQLAARWPYVTPETLLGFVGNTGNAEATPPHLHLGIYAGIYAGESYLTCDWEVENPYPLLVDRAW